VVDFAEAQVGKGYLPIGSGVYSEGSWSCVGIAEAALRAAGRETLDFWSTSLASTPLELFWATHPVSDIEVTAGEPITIPTYTAQVSDESPQIAQFIRGYYTKARPYSMNVLELPPGASFTAAVSSTSYGHDFKWTPQEEHAGKTFQCSWEVRANTVNGFAFASRTLTIKVRPLPVPAKTTTPNVNSINPGNSATPAKATDKQVSALPKPPAAACPICSPFPCRCPAGAR
jgi:hypothetical protein